MGGRAAAAMRPIAPAGGVEVVGRVRIESRYDRGEALRPIAFDRTGDSARVRPLGTGPRGTEPSPSRAAETIAPSRRARACKPPMPDATGRSGTGTGGGALVSRSSWRRSGGSPPRDPSAACWTSAVRRPLLRRPESLRRGRRARTDASLLGPSRWRDRVRVARSGPTSGPIRPTTCSSCSTSSNTSRTSGGPRGGPRIAPAGGDPDPDRAGPAGALESARRGHMRTFGAIVGGA
jgi:hypothetical protein